jgi:hypothetical protein
LPPVVAALVLSVPALAPVPPLPPLPPSAVLEAAVPPLPEEPLVVLVAA